MSLPIGAIRPWKRGQMRKEAEHRWVPVPTDPAQEGHKTEAASGQEIILSKQALDDLLHHGDYSIISAGRNPNDPEEAKYSQKDERWLARHAKLRADVEKLGLNYTEVEGYYGGHEMSFIVYHERGSTPKNPALIVHGSEYAKVRALGTKYNQDSVIHSKEGRNEFHYTTGPKAGQHFKSVGFEYKPEPPDKQEDPEGYYTKVHHGAGAATRFALTYDDKAPLHPVSDSIFKGSITPYIGPRGGRWANPEHTVHWEDASSWVGRVRKMSRAHSTPLHVGDMLDGAEATLRGKAVESLVAVWGEGERKKVLRRIGTSFVTVYEREVEAMRRAGNARLTHNHTTDTFFSPDDLRLAVRADLAQLRLVLSGGVWILDRPDAGWERVSEALDVASGAAMDQARQLIAEPSDLAPDERWKGIWEEASRMIGHGFMQAGFATFRSFT